MRPMPSLRARAAAALALVLCLAGAARADKLLFSGEHGIRFSNALGSEVVATGTGIAIVNGSAGHGPLHTLELTAPFAAITATVLPSITGPISSVRLDNVRINPTFQGGVFAPVLGAAQGATPALTRSTVPHAGLVRLCQNSICTAALSRNLSDTVSGVAVGTGVGGSWTVGGAGSTRVTVMGAPWTVGTTTVSFRTSGGMVDFLTGMGFVQGPASMTGSTATASGTVQLVTGSQVTTVGGNVDLSGHITRLTLHFTPEPRLLLLLGSGALGLALLGRQRIRGRIRR